MKATVYLVFLAVSLVFTGCVSTGRPSLPEKPSFRVPTKRVVVKPKTDWTIRGQEDLKILIDKGATVKRVGKVLVVDLKGLTIDGSNQKGSGNQDENQSPLARVRTPVMFKNGFIHNNKNALTFYAPDCGVDNITWTKIGEDAIATADGAKNATINNCEFINDGDGDKSIQLNEADGAVVTNNLVYGGITGARIGKYAYSQRNDLAKAGGNTFIGQDTAWNVGEVRLMITKKNTYRSVGNKFVGTNGARIDRGEDAVTAK